MLENVEFGALPQLDELMKLHPFHSVALQIYLCMSSRMLMRMTTGT